MFFAASLWAGNTKSLQAAAGGFGIRASYDNVPDATAPGGVALHPVVYSLPVSGSIYAGPVTSYFDVYSRIPSGVEMVSVFGMIMYMNNGSSVRFVPGAIEGNPPENNIPFSLNPSFPRNTPFSEVIADANVAGFPADGRSVAAVGLYPVRAQNAPVRDLHGLLAMPIQVFGGVVGMFPIRFNRDPDFTGFTNTTQQVFDNSPMQDGMLEVRASVRGDLNGDGVANSDDVPGFLAAISDTPGFKSVYPWLQTDYVADFNEDRAITFGDVTGFEAACACSTGLPALVGDVNRDMVVDRLDVATVILNLGNGGLGFDDGDYDNDGQIGVMDLAMLQMHLGDGIHAGSPGITAVPEPSTYVLVLSALASVVWLRWRGESISV